MKLGDSVVLCRLAEDGDLNFIRSTWLRSSKDLTRMGKEDFFSFTRPQVEADLKNGTTIVACDEAMPTTIYGWACFRDGVLRWAYTSYQLRNNGIHTFIRKSYEQAVRDADDGRAGDNAGHE